MDKIRYYIIVAVLILSNLLTIHKLYRTNQMVNILVKNSNLNEETKLHLKRNLFLNYKYSHNKLDTSQILFSSINKPIDDLIINRKIILFYPEDVCDVCEQDLFYYLKKRKAILDNIIAFVPITSFSEFKAYNSQYELNIPVVGYEGIFQSLPISNGRGMFVVVDSKLNINKIFLPQKPLHRDLLDEFFKLYNINPSTSM